MPCSNKGDGMLSIKANLRGKTQNQHTILPCFAQVRPVTEYSAQLAFGQVQAFLVRLAMTTVMESYRRQTRHDCVATQCGTIDGAHAGCS